MNKGQTRKGSLIETFLGIIIGYGVAIASQVFIFPYFGIHVSLSQNLLIGLFFTFVSVVRSYFVRRLFNWLGQRGYFVAG